MCLVMVQMTMIACAVYQVMIYIVKTIFLTLLLAGYLIIYIPYSEQISKA